MNLWTMWLDLIGGLLAALSANMGLGLAIIVGTVLLRSALVPLTWTTYRRNVERQRQITALQGELAQIKEQYQGRPDVQAQRTLDLYRKHGITLFDGKGILAAVAQMPIFL